MSDDNNSDLKNEAVHMEDDEPQSQSQRNGEKDEKSMKDLDWFLNRSQVLPAISSLHYCHHV